jgi:hypothetical protein
MAKAAQAGSASSRIVPGMDPRGPAPVIPGWSPRETTAGDVFQAVVARLPSPVADLSGTVAFESS